MRHWRQRSLRMGIGAMLVASLAMGTASAEAADGGHIRYSEEYKDPGSGSVFYEARIESDQGMAFKYLFKDSAGDWHRLEDRVKGITSIPNRQHPAIYYDWESSEERLDAFWNSEFLDAAHMRIVIGHNYALSPDGKWGIEDGYNPAAFVSSDGKSVYSNVSFSYFIKNMQTGEVREWQLGDHRATWYWLPDGRVLVHRFQPLANQNEIAIYIPKEDRWQRLVLGSMYDYNEEKELFVFAKNEPTRKRWVFDLRTNSARAYDSSRDDKLFSASNDSSNSSESIATEGPSDIDSLPVTNLSAVHLYEHEVTTGEGTIPVPFVFRSGSQTYLPLRPFLEPLGIDWSYSNSGNLSEDLLTYELTRNGKAVRIDKSNSRSFQFRLYVTPDVLKSLGVNVLSVKATELYQ